MERSDPTIRRQLLKSDAPMIGQPFTLTGDNARAVQANTRHLALMLLDTTIKDRASRAAAFTEQLMDASLAVHVTDPTACKRGCSHCCTTYVSTSLPEIFLLAQAVRKKPMTRARITDAAARARAMPQLRREVDRVVCPILDSHACSEYASRPVVCRAVLSTSLATCERIFLKSSRETFTAPGSLAALRSYIVVMLRAALVLARLSPRNYEMTHALQVALAQPDSEERWLAGEPIFDRVAIDQLDLGTSALTKIVDGLAAAVRPTI